MARSRRGSFGLRPRTAPSLTNTIVALSREYVAKRDQLIMDAWRNGGTFEGKPVTDAMVLAYWKGREQGLDPSDPVTEGIKDQIMQLHYAIEQSKADVLHAQGKLSDMAYAQFFLRWAKKIPASSEFYRTLQKDAAQLIESAKAKGRAGAEAAKVKAFNEFVQTTQAQHIAIGDAMTAALSYLSKATGMSYTANGDELLQLLTQNVKANPGEYRQLLDAIKAGDPSWDGQLTESYFSHHINDAAQGYSAIADKAKADGYVSAYASATKGMSSMSEWAQNIRVWPVAQSYSQAETAWLKVMQDPNSSEMDKLAASRSYSETLSRLAGTPGIDPASKTMLTADSLRLLGEDGGDAPSFGTSMLGRPGVDPQTTMQIAAFAQLKAERDANPLAYAYAPVDKNGQFDVTGQGALGIVPLGQVPSGAQAVMVPGIDGHAVMAMVPMHNIYAVNPSDPNGPRQPAGFVINYNVGGRQITMWGYVDANKQPHWSLTSPLVDGATTTTDSKGDITVTPPARVDPTALAQAMDPTGKLNIAAEIQQGVTSGETVDRSTTGTVKTIKWTFANGALSATQTVETVDPITHQITGSTTQPFSVSGFGASSAFSQSRLAAGDVPGSTFTSPLQASVNAAGYAQSRDQVAVYASDPQFQQQFLVQTMSTLGTSNPYDPRIASAWKAATTSNIEPDVKTLAAQRADLTFPGGHPGEGRLQVPSLTFGSPELRIPEAPNSANTRDYNVNGQFSGVAPQLTPAQPAPTAPAPSATPAPAVTPTPTAITPTATPVTTVTPTPVVAPISVAPAPVPAYSKTGPIKL